MRLLAERGIDAERVDYHVTGLTEAEIRDLLGKAGAGPRDVLRTREPAYAEHVAGRELSDDELIALMAEHPELRPAPDRRPRRPGGPRAARRAGARAAVRRALLAVALAAASLAAVRRRGAHPPQPHTPKPAAARPAITVVAERDSTRAFGVDAAHAGARRRDARAGPAAGRLPRTPRSGAIPCCTSSTAAAATTRDWTRYGAAERITARTPLIVVMPDAGRDAEYTDWYQGGAPILPRWETYHVGQLVPWVDKRFRTIAARRGRAIAGLSMGGFGALSYAGRHPATYAAVASFSGALEIGSEGALGHPRGGAGAVARAPPGRPRVAAAVARPRRAAHGRRRARPARPARHEAGLPRVRHRARPAPDERADARAPARPRHPPRVGRLRPGHARLAVLAARPARDDAGPDAGARVALGPPGIHLELLLAEREDERVRAARARGDRQRRLGSARLELDHRDVAPAEEAGEVAHRAREVGDAAGRGGDLAGLDVDLERRHLAHARQPGRRRGVELDRVGEEHDTPAGLDLGRVQPAHVDDAGSSPGPPSTTATARSDARAVEEVAQEHDDRVEGADRRDDLGDVVLAVIAGQDRRRRPAATPG